MPISICDYQHDSIVYEGVNDCPFCEMQARLGEQVEELKDEIKNLETLIDKQNG